MKEENYTYYIPVVEQAVQDHINGIRKITTRSGEELTIHDGETFTQCYIPLDQEEPDRKKIRSQLRRRYFISEKYCQVLEVEVKDKNNPTVYWIKDTKIGGETNKKGRTHFEIMLDKKKTKSDPKGEKHFKKGIMSYTLYGLVFGCYISDEAKKRITNTNDLYTAININGAGGIETHHTVPYEETQEPKEKGHIYDISELEIITYEEHLLLDRDPNYTTLPQADTVESSERKYIDSVNTTISKDEKKWEYENLSIFKNGREQEILTNKSGLFVYIFTSSESERDKIKDWYKNYFNNLEHLEKLVNEVNNTIKGTGFVSVKIEDNINIYMIKRIRRELKPEDFAYSTVILEHTDEFPEEYSYMLIHVYRDKSLLHK